MEGETKKQIINQLAEEKKVEEFVSNTAKTSSLDLDDLVQDIYLSLLEQEEEKLKGMYERGELDWWIARMVTNNIISTTSPFYSHYRKWTQKRSDLIGDLNNKYEEDEDTRWMQKKNVPPSSGN